MVREWLRASKPAGQPQMLEVKTLKTEVIPKMSKKSVGKGSLELSCAWFEIPAQKFMELIIMSIRRLLRHC